MVFGSFLDPKKWLFDLFWDLSETGLDGENRGFWSFWDPKKWLFDLFWAISGTHLIGDYWWFGVQKPGILSLLDHFLTPFQNPSNADLTGISTKIGVVFGTPKTGFLPLFAKNQAAKWSIFSKIDQKWSILIKSRSKMDKKSSIFQKSHFLAGFFKNRQNLRSRAKNAFMRLKSVIWETPKKRGVKELLYYFHFLGGPKKGHFLAQKWVIFWSIWTGSKIVEIVGSWTVYKTTFSRKHVPTFWSKSESVFWTPQKVRFFDFFKRGRPADHQNHRFWPFFALFPNFGQKHVDRE